MDMTPGYFIQRADPTDPASALIFYPEKGSDELHDALRVAFPHLNNLQARMRQAVIEFYMAEQEHDAFVQFNQSPSISDQASPQYSSFENIRQTYATEMSFPNTPAIASELSPEMFSFSVGSLSSNMPPLFPSTPVSTDASLSASPATSSRSVLPTQEQLSGVWALPSRPDAKVHKRRCMTEEEKSAYKKKRLQGACSDCKRRRRKCQHTEQAMASSSGEGRYRNEETSRQSGPSRLRQDTAMSDAYERSSARGSGSALSDQDESYEIPRPRPEIAMPHRSGTAMQRPSGSSSSRKGKERGSSQRTTESTTSTTTTTTTTTTIEELSRPNHTLRSQATPLSQHRQHRQQRMQHRFSIAIADRLQSGAGLQAGQSLLLQSFDAPSHASGTSTQNPSTLKSQNPKESGYGSRHFQSTSRSQELQSATATLRQTQSVSSEYTNSQTRSTHVQSSDMSAHATTIIASQPAHSTPSILPSPTQTATSSKTPAQYKRITRSASAMIAASAAASTPAPSRGITKPATTLVATRAHRARTHGNGLSRSAIEATMTELCRAFLPLPEVSGASSAALAASAAPPMCLVKETERASQPLEMHVS